ncbi:MAG: hypothetical protein MUO63_14540 [Desulfobulbaceae bacterium]|nr:hypothetical protein [Desulfobulbaceae bacterium]
MDVALSIHTYGLASGNLRTPFFKGAQIKQACGYECLDQGEHAFIEVHQVDLGLHSEGMEKAKAALHIRKQFICVVLFHIHFIAFLLRMRD